MRAHPHPLLLFSSLVILYDSAVGVLPCVSARHALTDGNHAESNHHQHDDSTLLLSSVEELSAHVHPARHLPGGIPRHIHQSWKDKHVPEFFHNWPWTWKHYHPHWTYTLWTDEDNRRLVEHHYPWFLKTYDSLPKPVMKADAARYLYMHR